MAALTLAEAAKLAMRKLESGVIMNIANFDPVLSGGGVFRDETQTRPVALPFITVNGKTYDYVRENSRGTVFGWGALNETITSSAPTFTEVSVSMKYLYDQLDIPNPLRVNYAGDSGNSIDQQAMIPMLRRVTSELMDTLYYGSTSADADRPNGLHLSVDSSMIIEENGNSATPAALQFVSLDELLQEKMKFGVDMLVSTRTVKRRLGAAARSTSVAGTLNFTPEQIGERVYRYDGIPFHASDFMVNTELFDSSGDYSAKTGGAASTVWALKFGETMMHAVQRNPGLEMEYFDRLEDVDSARWRVKWYVVPVVRKSLWAVGAITNVDSATAVVA